MTLTAPAVSETSMPSPAAVCAVVLADDTHKGLAATLAALRAQSHQPDRVIVLDHACAPTGASSTDASSTGASTMTDSTKDRVLGAGSTPPSGPSAADDADSSDADDLADSFAATPEVRQVGSLGLRSAVSALVGDEDLPPQTLLWLLPVGALPEGRALGRLVEAHRRSPSVAMVGPKLLVAAHPQLIRSVGIRSTTTGRLVDDPGDRTPDQGQFDGRADVLAVPAAGALVEAGLVRDLEGWEPLFGDVGADLDFGWRAQQLGRRVLVAPRARVMAAPGLGAATATTGARGRAARRVALTHTALWVQPFHALWLLVSALVGALVLLLLKRPRQAWAAFGEVGALEPVQLVRARWRQWRRERRRRQRVAAGQGVTPPRPIRRRDLTLLFVSGAEIRRGLTDHVHDALFPSRSSEEETAPERRGSTASRLLAHPGLLSAIAALAAVLIAGRGWGTHTLSGVGGGLVGGELLGGTIGSSALWHSWTDTWSGGGLGAHAVIGAPHLALLALLTRVVETLPWIGSVASPGGLVVALIVLLAPVFAALSAYVSARVLTRHRWLRAAAALVWALLGAVGPIVAQGRLGPAVALVVLPTVGAGLVLLARRDGTATAAWATALALGLLGAFAPVLLIPLALLCLLLVVGARTAGARWRALVPALVGPLLLGPWWLAVRDDPRLLFAGPGSTTWGVPDPPWWQVALLHPGGAGSTPFWLSIPLVLLAAFGLLRGRRVQSEATGAALLALVGLVGVLVAPRLLLATVPDGASAAGGSVTVWTGLPMLLLQLGLLAAAVIGLSSTDEQPHETSAVTESAPVKGRQRTVLGLGAAALALLGLALGGALGRVTFGQELAAWSDPRPAVAIEHTDGDIASRTLFLVPDQAVLGYKLVSREVSDVSRSLPVDRRADAALAPAVSALVDGTGTAQDLAPAAVGIIGLPESADPGMRRALDSADGLTRLVARDGWDYWRVAAEGNLSERPVAPPRLRLLGSDGLTSVVPSLGQHAATDTGISASGSASLVVAESPGWAKEAVVRIDDERVRPSSMDGKVAYAVPAGDHSLTIRLDEATAPWRRAQLALVVAVIFLAIPFGSRASRRRS